MKDICRSYDCPEVFYCDKITTDSWCWKFTDWSWGWDKGVQPYGWFTSAFVIYTVPESLDPDTAHIWWAGKELMRNKCLQDHIGKNEKTKVYLPKCHLVTNYTYLFPIVHNIYSVEKMLALALRALHLWPESCHCMTNTPWNLFKLRTLEDWQVIVKLQDKGQGCPPREPVSFYDEISLVYWKTFQVAHVSRSEVLLSLLDRLKQSSKVSDTGEDCPISWWMDGSLLMLRHTRQCWHGTIGNKNSRRWHNPKKDKIFHRFPLVISPHGFSTFLHLIHFQALSLSSFGQVLNKRSKINMWVLSEAFCAQRQF